MKDAIKFPKGLDAKGEVTVELFDMNGNKTQEVKGHNFIADGMKYAYRAMLLSAFTRYKATGGTGINPVGDPFRKMLLTTADHEADPAHEWIVKGDLVGYAYTDGVYAGDDTKRGTYNKNESFKGEDRVHIVIDFPTSAANGTINSVYFVTEFNSPMFDISEVPGVKKPFGNNCGVIKYNNKYYVLEGSTDRTNTLNVYDESFALSETVTLPWDAVCLAIYNGDVYLGRWNYGNVYKLPISDLNATPQMVVETGENNASGIAYDPVNNHFMVITNYSYWLEGNYVIMYDKDFNILSRNPLGMYMDVSQDYDGYNCKLTYIGDGFFTDNYFIVRPDGSRIDRGGGVAVTGMFDDLLVSDSGYLYPKHGISSRFKLPSPVTKTTTNTMKVTYDFVFPNFYSDGY